MILVDLFTQILKGSLTGTSEVILNNMDRIRSTTTEPQQNTASHKSCAHFGDHTAYRFNVSYISSRLLGDWQTSHTIQGSSDHHPYGCIQVTYNRSVRENNDIWRHQWLSSGLTWMMDRQALTHWGRDKMAADYLTTFPYTFSSMKIYKFRSRFHWSLLPRVHLTIFQHWIR